ncbi:TIGR04500 family putative peptide maturation system protein [Microbispora sp. H13382]|uniref:TIGR04500 family putative peptide maturation system protein n=1 Tax=Microbispora sp. H13382 TaxID=2729112 RepID=UPI00160118CA|nr:TIGR04500 family putative peptide maturation system protein [Microbispora sp. H13382]
MSDFGMAVESGVRLLRSLPRRRPDVEEARRTAAAWAAERPGLSAQLVVDVRPGTPVVDYDLLLAHPEGGTVAVSAPPEDGVPWLVDHSTHWAAGGLVTVDDVHLSVAQALTMLRSLSRRDATPYEEIVDQCVILNELLDDDEPLTPGDLQVAADEFRRGRGLLDRASTLAWLEEVGMSGEMFETYISGIARRRRFRRRKESELGPGYLAAHRADFDRVRAVWVVSADRYAASSPQDLLVLLPELREARVIVGERLARELPAELRGAPAGAVVGPCESEEGYLSGTVLERRPAEDDAETLAAAGRAAFAEWLAGRRRQARIEWHWS